MSEIRNNGERRLAARDYNVVDVEIDLDKEAFTPPRPSKVPNLQLEKGPHRSSGKTTFVDVEIDMDKDGFNPPRPSKIPGLRKPPAPPAPDEAAPPG